MARPLRIEYAGACYHVTNRGNQRARVFHERRHHQLFLAKLGDLAGQYEVSVHTYCLMPNHFHLLLTTRRANLSRFMQSLLTGFTISLNRRRGGSGHVFQGRFKAHLVEAQRYLAEVSRYIHLNPVRTAATKPLGLEERRQYLRGYEWSSFPILIGVAAAPPWMDLEPVLMTWGADRAAQMPAYRQYVEQGLTTDLASPFLAVREQALLGSDGFVDRVRRAYLLRRPMRDRHEEVALKHLVHSLDPQALAESAARVYGVEVSDLLRRRAPCREARRLLMYVAAVHCRHSRSLSALAKWFGVTPGGLGMARQRVAAALQAKSGRDLRGQLARVLDAARDFEGTGVLSINS